MRSRTLTRDPTRPLPLEELAELQLEQGFVERALRIYERLAEDPRTGPGYVGRIRTLRTLLPPEPVSHAVQRIEAVVVR